MKLIRNESPEYRALVVENERDFRKDLIYTVESLDLGVSVLGEASDFDDALAQLDSGDFDLLITDINLTDTARFTIGVRDGIALAERARNAYGIPSVFITAFADYDPAVLRRAGACEPIGFVQKQGAEIDTQTRQLMHLALRRLNLIRRERELATQLSAVVSQAGDAVLFIDREGRILDVDQSACEFFECPGVELLDQHWEDIIRFTGNDDAHRSLAQCVAQGGSTAVVGQLTPRTRPQAIDVALRIAPATHLGERCVLLVVEKRSGPALDNGPGTSVDTPPAGIGAAAAVSGPDSEDGQSWTVWDAQNLHVLLQTTEPARTIALLLETDTPIAVVAEDGMARVQLIDCAARDLRLEQTRNRRVINGSTWGDESRMGSLLAIFAASANTLIVIRDPQRMHPALQHLVGEIMMTRRIPSGDQELAMPNCRFAVTLPARPTELVREGALDDVLASALGAGCVPLAPLRETSEAIPAIAQTIYTAELQRIGLASQTLSATTNEVLRRHRWPGNLVELQDRIRAAVTRDPHGELTARELGIGDLESPRN